MVPYEVDLGGFTRLFSPESRFTRAFLNTLLVCGTSIVIGIFVNLMAGFGLARFWFPGRRLLFVLVLFSYMVPFEAVVIPLATIANSVGLIDKLLVLILPSLANGFLIFMFRQFYQGIHTEFYEAAVVDGATIRQTIQRIYLPLTKTVMITAGLVLFLAHWNSFFWPVVVIRRPENWVVQMALATGSLQWGFAGALVSIAIPVLVLLPLQRFFQPVAAAEFMSYK